MNQIATYRQKPLEPDEFHSLDRIVNKALSFRERLLPVVSRVKDEYGDMVERKDFILAGPEVFQRGEITERLIESMCRPVNPRHLAVHLTNLTHHKPYARGEEGWRVVCADLMRDLEGISEYAVMKSCDHFRLSENLHYFPDTAVFVRYTRDLDFALRNIKSDKPSEKNKNPETKIVGQVNCKRNVKRVNRILSIGMKKPEHRTKREQQFMTAMKNKAEREKKIMEENKCDEDGVVK